MASSRSSSSYNGFRRIGEKRVERCKCGDEVIILTSWTEQNYGRRFVKCPNYKERWGCNYFNWFDGPIDNQISDELKKLKDDNGDVRRRLKWLESVMYILISINMYLIWKVLNV
ncbi:uncharacterized protein At4g04775-like [Neltuma alba]|uniref:uncharacterized protein At4g04775-like n=1 Tax=Neltuma alba TaxID=207710 RepID=UPI0010A330D9|nr:uncharacterized protein At4g04775-like [Prosopis alba]